MQAELCEFTRRLLSTQAENQAANLLLEFYKDMGADGGNIWFATGVGEERSESASVSDYPREFREIIYDPSVLKNWHVAHQIAVTLAPVRWGWEICRQSFSPSSEDYRISQIAHEEFGIKNILAFPVPTAGFTGSSGVSFYAAASVQTFGRLVAAKGWALRFAGVLTHHHAQNVRRKEVNKPCLTSREKECLLWLARGFRCKQIAHKLNIREVTVNLHLANARKRLAVRTREQALAAAILTGAIAP